MFRQISQIHRNLYQIYYLLLFEIKCINKTFSIMEIRPK